MRAVALVVCCNCIPVSTKEVPGKAVESLVAYFQMQCFVFSFPCFIERMRYSSLAIIYMPGVKCFSSKNVSCC